MAVDLRMRCGRTQCQPLEGVCFAEALHDFLMSDCLANEFKFCPWPKVFRGSLPSGFHRVLLAKNERNQSPGILLWTHYSSSSRSVMNLRSFMVSNPYGMCSTLASDLITSYLRAWPLSSSLCVQSLYRAATAEYVGDNSTRTRSVCHFGRWSGR